jgi:hypothetical protein
MRNPVMSPKSATNPLYCIITKNVNDELLEENFEADASFYLEPDDGDCIGGFDIDNESIYLLFIDEWKIFKMIDFFSRNNVLIKYERVPDVIDLINSDKKYLKFYSEERNKTVLDEYILHHVSIDDILDRISENRNNGGFSLLPVEQLILETVSGRERRLA